MTQETIDAVKEGVSATDVISRYVDLRRNGRDSVGLCPFHDEDTPSMFVSESKGSYYCFGCGAGGDVIDFVRRIEGFNFQEAVAMLAREAGVEIEEGDKEEWTREAQEHSAYRELAREFAVQLEHSKRATDYLHARGVTDPTIFEFGLGYAPADLIQWIKEVGLLEEYRDQLDAAGVVRKSFGDRIMIPRYSPTGRLVGFSGRSIADAHPKYLDTHYQKGDILYGMPRSANDIRQAGEAVVFEGYADLWSMHQQGLRNGVAVCGTALTDVHARVISRSARRATVMFDGDMAGKLASIKAMTALAKANVVPFVTTVPDGLDPDGWVQRGGRPDELMGPDTRRDFVAYIMSLLGKGLETLADVYRAVAKTIKRFSDPFLREQWIQIASDRLGIDRYTMIEMVKAV